MADDVDALPEDPMSQYDCWAVEPHECMGALVTAGFTPEQAFQIVLRGVSRGWFDTFDEDD